jgi:hypothetical protein
MRIVATFNPSTETSDTFNAGFAGGTGKIVVYNESNINLQLSWGSFSTYCPAWTAMLYCISTNNVNITWQAQSQLVSNGAPISQVIVEAYGPTEAIVGTFPAPLVRQTNIGNSVPLSSSATSVANDGNPANTPVVEATPAGDASSAALLTAGGTLTLGNATHSGSISSDNGAFKTDGSGNVTSNNQTITSGHKLITPEVDSPVATDLIQNVPTGQKISLKVNAVEQAHISANGLIVAPGKLGKATDGDIIDAGGNETYLKSRSTGSIHFQVPDGTSIATVQGTGIKSELGASNFDIDSAGTGFVRLLRNGVDILDATDTGPRLGTGMTLRLVSGTMSRQQEGHSASINGVTITHGLGTTPITVLINADIAQAGSATVGAGSVGATTFVATVGAGSGFWWRTMSG